MTPFARGDILEKVAVRRPERVDPKGTMVRNPRDIGTGARRGALLLFAVACLLLAACSDLGYYVQCATGHLGVMARCEPIPDILADPRTAPELKGRLETVLAIRDFASRELSLPDNGSYRSYGDLGRSAAVWNVVAAPEFSLAPRQWCFPVAGCVSYRGYFERAAAEAFAVGLQEEGLEVDLYGVDAYSTLNWFDDPVLNTFLDRPEPYLAGVIFHELAHQVLYVQDDSRFNEAFASTVEMEGVRRWLQRGAEPAAVDAYREHWRRQGDIQELLASLRGDLAVLYGGGLPAQEMRRQKAALLEVAQRRYRELREEWGGYHGYDPLFEGLNNARLAATNTYHELVPPFQRLLAAAGDLAAFYRAAAELGRLPPQERHARLRAFGQTARAAGEKGGE